MSARALERVETERLVCERLRPEHGAELAAMLRDPRVARTTWPIAGGPTEPEIGELLLVELAHWERHGFGMWLLSDRRTGAAVGRGGLQYTTAAGPLEVEAGWVIIPERWGRGLATELARASIEVAFGALGLPEIIGFALSDNSASRRVMEKTGFLYEREFEHAGLPHALYRRGPSRSSPRPPGPTPPGPVRPARPDASRTRPAPLVL